MEEKSNLSRTLPLVATASGLVISASPAPVLAQTAGSNGIAEMTAAVTSLGAIKDAAIPIAIAVIVFGSGALIVKRLIYS